MTPLDPDETKDYRWDWTAEMTATADAINASEWLVPDGVTKQSDTHDDTTTTIWLTGADPTLTSITVTNRITTAGGRTLDKTAVIAVRQK